LKKETAMARPTLKVWRLRFSSALAIRQIAILLILTAALHVSTAAHAALGDNGLWDSFRERYPFHVQVVGISDPDTSGERILIISEPPPTLPRGQFRETLHSIFGDALVRAELRRQPIGYDGWVEDVVATVKYSNNSAGIQHLRNDLALLAERLFGTAYKFAPVRLSANKPMVTERAPPNLTVTAAELQAWLLTDDAALISVDFGTRYLARTLMLNGRPGVYYSEARGLVVLVLPRQIPTQSYRDSLRKFALDSDAVVGAIAIGDNRLAIVGRERDTSLEAVPPLRAETILALAATQEGELGQSYERTSAFAGKLVSGDLTGKDWAPIYLSGELYNSEFGSLLNITDQMLKSWSEAGSIEYVRFGYPKPGNFPFPNGLLKQLGSESVTYNWNTVGVGSVFAYPDAHIFTVTRTGSLPVSYFPGTSAAQSDDAKHADAAEDTGYDYFSGLRNAYLGRVVQYAALYQIFRAFPVNAARDQEPPKNFHAATSVAVALARTTLRQIADGRAKPDTAVLRDRQRYVAARSGAVLTDADLQLRMLKIMPKIAEQIDKAAGVLHELEATYGPATIDRLALLMADRSALDQDGLEAVRKKLEDVRTEAEFEKTFRRFSSGELQAFVDLNLLRKRDTWEPVQRVLPLVTSATVVKDQYVTAARAIEGDSYIKTASIVLSWSSRPGDELLVGGHNLYSHTTAIESSPAVPRGQVVIGRGPDGSSVLRINPDDAPHSNQLARAFERHADRPDVADYLRTALKNDDTIRPMKVGLAIRDSPPNAGRGLSRSLEGDLPVGELGQRAEIAIPDKLTQFESLADQGKFDLIITRDTDGYVVFRAIPKPSRAIRTPTEPAMLETFNTLAEETATTRLPTGVPPLRIGTSGNFSTGELNGIVRTQELRTAAGGGGGFGGPPRPPRTVTGLMPEPERPSGYFFSVIDGDKQAPGYAVRGAGNDSIILRFLGKGAGKAEIVLRRPVEWSKATVKQLGTEVGSGENAGLTGISFEITLPLKPESLLEHVWGGRLVLKLTAYFRRSDINVMKSVSDVISARIDANTNAQVPGIDGIASLKHDILTHVGADKIEFHTTSSSDDLIIVENGTERHELAG
jgi:hypothetical protein